jgi:murein DD-endopeptidase MepM/ murein hydrolase activator NlpD
MLPGVIVHGQRQPSAAAGGSPLTVTTRAGAFVPGDVALVSIASTTSLTGVTGSAFGKPIAPWPAGAGQWQALVAINLETKPGTYDVSVQALRAGGERTSRAVKLVVQAKQFETRRLTVDGQFVDPPQSEVSRIQREAARMAAIFAESSTPRLWHGSFIVPVPGRATSSFGRLSVFNGEPRGRHQGADFTAATGTPVRAPNAGRIVLAEDLYFSGNAVIVDHGGGLYSLFAHMSRLGVMEGATVARGDLLGDSGATGRVTGPHLHWAVRLRDVSVDPLSLVKALEGMPE